MELEMNKHTENRRNEQRLHLSNLQIKVRKHGLNDHLEFIDCVPIDISFNGLAFSTSALQLALSQKLDIRISFGHKLLEGTAVICHIEQQQEAIQYGVLYIDLNPTIEETFCLETLSSTLVKDLAINMADNAVLGSCRNEEEVLLRKAQVFLFDAIEAFKARLSELVDDKVDEHGKVYQLATYFILILVRYP